MFLINDGDSNNELSVQISGISMVNGDVSGDGGGILNSTVVMLSRDPILLGTSFEIVKSSSAQLCRGTVEGAISSHFDPRQIRGLRIPFYKMRSRSESSRSFARFLDSRTAR